MKDKIKKLEREKEEAYNRCRILFAKIKKLRSMLEPLELEHAESKRKYEEADYELAFLKGKVTKLDPVKSIVRKKKKKEREFTKEEILQLAKKLGMEEKVVSLFKN